MPWRYQPVIETDSTGHELVYLIEVYFDDQGNFLNWTWGQQWGCGETIEELQGDLVHMLSDAYKWKPVRYEEIKVGITFERAFTQEQSEAIARMIETFSFAHKPRIT